MGSTIGFAAASAALAIQSAPVGQQAPLKPSSSWNVEYADEMCLLARDFGEGPVKVTLGFKPGPASEYVRLVVITRDVSTKVERGDARLDFDGQAPVTARFVTGPIKNKPMRIMAVDMKVTDLVPLSSAKELHIRAGRTDLRLAPTRVGDAMKALQDCEKDLLVTWGMDSAVLATIAKFPRVSRKGGFASYFSINDYPMEAIRRREQGTVGTRVHVATDGRVTECRVIESSGSAILDIQTCDIIRTRFRYEPARNHDGQPVPSFTFQRIRWELPES